MKTQNLIRGGLILLLTIIAISSLPSATFATVGGPTYVYALKYNPADESVYYTQISQSGRGCPPELWKVSLNTGNKVVVFSCSDGEAILNQSGGYDFNPVNTKIDNLVKNFKDLTPISLPKNTLAIDVNFISTEKLTPQDDWILRSHFTANVYQGTTEIVNFPITGCNIAQPFTFAGYAIPGFDKKIILLLSTKNDCFEGGYISETLHVTGGLNNLDKTYANDSFKNPSPLLPSESTLIVFEKDTPNFLTKTETTADGDEDVIENNNNEAFSLPNLVTVAIISILAGIILGKFIKK